MRRTLEIIRFGKKRFAANRSLAIPQKSRDRRLFRSVEKRVAPNDVFLRAMRT
jgi:hypothetical protein